MSEDLSTVISAIQKDLDTEGWPDLRLLRLRMRNFGRHEDVEVDFSDRSGRAGMVCLVGPNGTGKTTVLTAIQMLFYNYSSYSPDRYRRLMAKNIRNPDRAPELSLTGDFIITAEFQTGDKRYTVEMTSTSVVSWHPQEIGSRIQHMCNFATFDRDLNVFTLKRDKWEAFRGFFSGVTGFPVEEETSLFSLSLDRDNRELLKKYVLGFNVGKPKEKISHRQCSAGEKKIIKCFSTILNRPVAPAIILIDNVTDHVDVSRHIPLIGGMERCFPNSQIITTCHSIPVQRDYPDRDRIIDMRTMSSAWSGESMPWLADQPWRLRIHDEALSISSWLSAAADHNDLAKALCDEGRDLAEMALKDREASAKTLAAAMEAYLKLTAATAAGILVSSPPSRIRELNLPPEGEQPS